MKKLSILILVVSIFNSFNSFGQDFNMDLNQEPLEINENVEDLIIQEEPQLICDEKGNLLVEKALLLEVFNELSEEKADDIAFAYQKESKKHELIFVLKGINVAYELEEDNKEYILSANGSMVKHTCTGEPCNQCEMSSTFWTSVSCSCKEAGEGNRCNHSVSSLTGGFPSMEVLISTLNKAFDK